MTNSDQTQVSVKPDDKKIRVPVNKGLAQTLKDNRGKVGLAAGVLASAGFISARDLAAQNTTADQANSEVKEASEKDMVKNEGSYLSIDAGDSILQSPEGASFKEAFKHAREELGPGGIFEWNGKHYNTFYAEEYAALTSEQKKEYAAKVSETIKEKESSIIESKEGQLVEVEYNADNILSIKVIDQDVIDNMQGLQVDLTGDGEANISFQSSVKNEEKAAEATAEESTEESEADADEKASEVAEEVEQVEEAEDARPEAEVKLAKDEEEETEAEEVVIDFDDLPDSDEGEDITHSGLEGHDTDEYPDIDQWNEELLQ